MPKTLIASLASSTSLDAELILAFEGLFPPFYPSSSAYPGRGTTLAANVVALKILTGAPA